MVWLGSAFLPQTYDNAVKGGESSKRATRSSPARVPRLCSEISSRHRSRMERDPAGLAGD